MSPTPINVVSSHIPVSHGMESNVKCSALEVVFAAAPPPRVSVNPGLPCLYAFYLHTVFIGPSPCPVSSDSPRVCALYALPVLTVAFLSIATIDLRAPLDAFYCLTHLTSAC